MLQVSTNDVEKASCSYSVRGRYSYSYSYSKILTMTGIVFEQDKLDAYRLSIEHVADSFRIAMESRGLPRWGVEHEYEYCFAEYEYDYEHEIRRMRQSLMNSHQQCWWFTISISLAGFCHSDPQLVTSSASGASSGIASAISERIAVMPASNSSSLGGCESGSAIGSAILGCAETGPGPA